MLKTDKGSNHADFYEWYLPMSETDTARTRARKPINIELESWSRRWLMTEQAIYCTACHAQQEAFYADHAFVHVQGCELGTPTFQYPWHELRAVLSFLPVVKL